MNTVVNLAPVVRKLFVPLWIQMGDTLVRDGEDPLRVLSQASHFLLQRSGSL